MLACYVSSFMVDIILSIFNFRAKSNMMYHMKNIINHEEEVVLPKCMYQVKNSFETLKEDEINIGISDQVNKFLKVFVTTIYTLSLH